MGSPQVSWLACARVQPVDGVVCCSPCSQTLVPVFLSVVGRFSARLHSVYVACVVACRPLLQLSNLILHKPYIG